jgi:hypothetical protein
MIKQREIAQIMVKTLHFAYGVDQTYTFEIGPKLAAEKTLLIGIEASNAHKR